MIQKDKLLLAFYGDDFTGSTDALEFLTLAGLNTILFLKEPSQKDLDRFPEVQAIGMAGKSRSMSPKEMEKELFPVFESFKKMNPAHFHYKVCSTFDSAPHVGNIGKAIEIGSSIFNQKTVLVSPAAPHLGRYCVFGNLFAKMGTFGDGQVYRIDRHPSMSKHPVTPALEGDLTLHLAKQTLKSIGLINISTIEAGKDSVIAAIGENKESEILFFDGFNKAHLQTIGSVFNELAIGKTLFSVGSSGIGMALGLDWKSEGIISEEKNFKSAGNIGPILVLSGSCSPVTENQIEYALENGFSEIALESEAVDILHQEKIIENTNKILSRINIKRILLAGGDTSSYAASELNILALEMIAPLAPGAPLCKAISDNELVNGLELNFKGGQVGTKDYFIKVLKGEKL